MKPPKQVDQPLEPYALYAAFVLMLVYVLNFLDRQLLAVLAEAVKADLKITDAQLGFLFGTAFSVFYAVFGMPLARWADVGSRKRLIGGSVAFWSVMTSLSGFVTSYAQLAVCRFGVGLGEAGASPASYSLLYDYFPRRLRATAIAIYTMGVNIGSGIGLFLGGAIMMWWDSRYAPGTAPLGLKGWQAAFLFVGLPGLVMSLWVLLLREPKRGRYDDPRLHVDVAPEVNVSPVREFGATLLSMLPVVNLALFAKQENGRAMLRKQIAYLSLFAGAVAFLVWLTGDVAQWVAVGLGVYGAVAWVQGIAVRDPTTYRLILGNRTLMTSMASMATVMFASYSFTFWTVPLYQRLFATTALETGTALGIANAVGGVLGVLSGGWLGDLFGSKRVGGKTTIVIASVLMSGISAAIMILAPDKTLFFFANILFVFSVQFGVGPFLSFIADQVPARARATTTALTLLNNSLIGFAIGPYVIGKVSDVAVTYGQTSGEALQTAMLMALVAMPISALLAWRAGQSFRADYARAAAT